MPLNNTALTSLAARAGLDLFERVFGRMTGAECVRVLIDGGLVTGTPTAPAGSTAESVLSALDWNDAGGTYTSIAPYRYSGGVLSAKPVSIRATLKTTFATDRSDFLNVATASDDVRALELIADMPPNYPGLSAPQTKLVMWSPADYDAALVTYPTIDDRGNTIRPLKVYYGLNGSAWNAFDVAYAASYLASQPAGRRWLLAGDFPKWESGSALSLWGKPTDIGGTKRAPIHDISMTSTSRRGLTMEMWAAWIVTSSSGWYQFFQQLRAAGETLYGAGNGEQILDGLGVDVERGITFANVKLASVHADGASDTFAQLFADGYWSTWRTDVLKPALDQTVWDTADTWVFQTDERCHAFDAAYTDYYAAKINLLSDVFRVHFPRPQTRLIDYELKRGAPGTHFNAPAYVPFGHPYGTARPLGSTSAVNLYDVWNGGRYNPATHAQETPTGYAVSVTSVDATADTVTLTSNPFTLAQRVYFSSAVGGLTPYADYYWRTTSGNTGSLYPTALDATNATNKVNLTTTATGTIFDAAKTEWNAFLDDGDHYREGIAGNQDAQAAWVAGLAITSSQNRVGTRGLAAELNILAGLLDSDAYGNATVGFYQPASDGITALDHKQVIELLAEVDDVLGAARIAERKPNTAYDDPFFVSTVFAGGRIVHRVVPNIQLTTTHAVVSDVLTFTNSGGSVSFAGGRIHAASQSAKAPLGYWVEQYSSTKALVNVGGEVAVAGNVGGGIL
jgi:hypothetical protein